MANAAGCHTAPGLQRRQPMKTPVKKWSPTQLSLRYLRKSGYQVAIAEYWFQPPGMSHGRRRDLFGFIDLVAVGHMELLMVQTTSHANARSRINKIKGEDCVAAAQEMVKVPGVQIHVHGWKRTDSKRPTIYDITSQLHEG